MLDVARYEPPAEAVPGHGAPPTLRPYQRDAVTAICRSWRQGAKRVAVALPTGAGKTVVFADVIAMALAAGQRVIVLAHRDELLGQATRKVRQALAGREGIAGATIGKVKATQRVWRADVVVASVATVGRGRGLAELTAEHARRPFRLVVVDEAHHITARSYVAALGAVGALDGDWGTGALCLGVSATLDRADGVALGEVLEEVAYTLPIRDLIKPPDGGTPHLLRPRAIRVRVQGLDLSAVKRSRSTSGLDDAAVAQALHDALAPEAIARAYREHCGKRLGIAFLPSVALSQEQAEAFTVAGIPAVHIDGETSDQARAAALGDLRRGRVQVVCNVGILTEGTDLPEVSAVVLGRPTQSASLYVQMVGRGLRPHPGQADCIILDVTGVTGRHKLATLASLGGAQIAEEPDDGLFDYEDEGLLLDDPEPGGGGGLPERAGMNGALHAEVVDLFEASHVAWKRTARGVWFLRAEHAYAFLAPDLGGEVGTYSAGWVHEKQLTVGGWIGEGYDIGYAMSAGEAWARDRAPRFGLDKGESWRRGKAISAAQLAEAARWKVAVVQGMTKGQVGDAIDIARASWRLDTIPMLGGVTQGGYWS